MKKINEIFFSLQGEGFHCGKPAIFIRFSGCNLVCDFCDTQHENYSVMSDDEIMDKISKYNSDFVVLTGGEPSLQVTEHFVDLLHKLGKFVAIETNGTHTIPSNIDWITISPKENTNIALVKADEVKVVYLGKDVEFWKNKISANHYFLQPCSCKNTNDVVDYILTHNGWRLSLQIHKYIGIL